MMLMTPPAARFPHSVAAPPPRTISIFSMVSRGIIFQSIVLKYPSLMGTPSTMTRTFSPPEAPKPRMLTTAAVGSSWLAGTWLVHTPSSLLIIWSRKICGLLRICSRVRMVVLTSILATLLPRPMLAPETTIVSSTTVGDSAAALSAATGGRVLAAGAAWPRYCDGGEAAVLSRSAASPLMTLDDQDVSAKGFISLQSVPVFFGAGSAGCFASSAAQAKDAQNRPATTRWICCIIILYSFPIFLLNGQAACACCFRVFTPGYIRIGE